MAARHGEGSGPGGVGAIYVVATPIGNLEDITLRAIRVLREVDLVAAEDTRRTRALLQHLGISKPVVAYYDAVEAARAPELVRRASAGESIALVSDAGTPLVADPGFRLIRAAAEVGVPIVPVPGPSAVLTLLSCAGLPVGRFTFVGFLPNRKSGRRRELASLAGREETLVFFESPRRLVESLRDMAEILGEREAVVGRELTKRFEEIRRGSLVDVAQAVAAHAEGAVVRGEVVVAVGGISPGSQQPRAGEARGAAGADGLEGGADGADADVRRLLGEALDAGGGVARAARSVAAKTGLSRRDLYRRAVELKRERELAEGRATAEE